MKRIVLRGTRVKTRLLKVCVLKHRKQKKRTAENKLPCAKAQKNKGVR